MKYKITIEATEEAGNTREVQYALNDLNIAFGDGLISWKEEEVQEELQEKKAVNQDNLLKDW